jgi:ribonucleotide reductase alpha subunit
VQYDDTINAWHTCPQSGRINASNPCVTGDTRVLTPGGIWRRIDQMIHLPSRVVTNLGSQEIHVTDGAFPTSQKDVYELRTAGGYSLKLTADHKVWTKHRGWVEAKDLETSDEVRLPSQPACVSQIGEPQDPTFFQLSGAICPTATATPPGCDWRARCRSRRRSSSSADTSRTTGGARLYNDDYVDRSMIDGAESAAEDAVRHAR